MNKVKRFFKNILISFLIFYIIIANTSSSYARNFDDAARAFLAEQPEQFINEHSGDSVYSLTVLPAAFRGSTFYSCCTSGVAYVYNAFLGLNIYNLGFSDLFRYRYDFIKISILDGSIFRKFKNQEIYWLDMDMSKW